MPAIPVSRDKAWTYWSKGLIAATNLDMTADSSADTKVLASLAMKRGHNAIRLWFGYAERYSIQEADITAFAQLSDGWNSTQKTPSAGADATITFASVATQISNILDTCQKLGMGVVLVTNYSQGIGGKLWKPESGYAQNLRNFWVRTYEKWGQHPALIGFDLLNEPDMSVDSMSFSEAQASTSEWPQLAQALISDIRDLEVSKGVATPLPLIVEGVYGGGPRSLGVFETSSGLFLNDPKNRLVFSFHHYDPGCFTHQGVLDWDYENLGTTYPLPGVWQRSYWYDGKPTYELREYRTVAQLEDGMQRVIDFAKKHTVPVFLGEFSAVEPTLKNIAASLSSQFRVSEVQNEAPWQAPFLEKYTTISQQSDFDALTAEERSKALEIFGQTKRRWITRLEVGADGYMTATMGHVIINGDELGTGFRISVSPKTLDQLKSEKPEVFANPASIDGYNGWAKVGAKMNDDFYTQPLASILGPSNARAAVLLVSVPQQVKLVRHASTIRFKAPAGAVSGTVIQGAECLVPGNSEPITMPVALLRLDDPRTAAQSDQARFTYARDLINLCQAKGFSWAWHSDDTNIGGFVGWRPSTSIGELLLSAASGRKLTSRA